MELRSNKYLMKDKINRNRNEQFEKQRSIKSMDKKKSKITSLMHGSAEKNYISVQQISKHSNDSKKSKEGRKSNEVIFEKNNQQIIIKKSQLSSFTKKFAQQKVHYEDKINSLQTICQGLERQICRLQNRNKQLEDEYFKLTNQNKINNLQFQAFRRQHYKLEDEIKIKYGNNRQQIYWSEQDRIKKIHTQGQERDSLDLNKKDYNKIGQQKNNISIQFNKDNYYEQQKNYYDNMEKNSIKNKSNNNQKKLKTINHNNNNNNNNDLQNYNNKNFNTNKNYMKNNNSNNNSNKNNNSIQNSNKGKSIVIRRKQSNNKSQHLTTDQTQNRMLHLIEEQILVETLNKDNNELRQQLYLLEGKTKILTIDNQHLKRELQLFHDRNKRLQNQDIQVNNQIHIQLKRKDKTINELIDRLNGTCQQLGAVKSNLFKKQQSNNMQLMIEKCQKFEQHIEKLSHYIIILEKQKECYRKNTMVSTPHFNNYDTVNLKNIFNDHNYSYHHSSHQNHTQDDYNHRNSYNTNPNQNHPQNQNTYKNCYEKSMIPQKLKCLPIDHQKMQSIERNNSQILNMNSLEGIKTFSIQEQDESFVVQKGHKALLAS